MGITAYAVGLIFLISRVWAAVNDPIFGVILDKAHLKSGKFLPFLRASNILLPLTTVLLFAVPNGLSVGWKLVWAFVAYLLYDVAYTICDVPIFAMTSAVTDQVHERINIMSRNTVVATITMIVMSLVIPQIYSAISIIWVLFIIVPVVGALLSLPILPATSRAIRLCS